jgi:hypothetical protein
LESYFECTSRRESRGWEHSVAAALIDDVEVIPGTEGSYSGERAFCPLCGEGAASVYQSGFSVPEGLRRHLVGWGDIRNQCFVLATASQLARDHWNDKFREAEVREEAARFARIQDRMRTEVLYRIDPLADPVLFDASLGFGHTARTESQLAWAEARLEALGLRCLVEGRIKSFVDAQEAYTVFADPRAHGEIQFAVYRVPLPKARSRRGLAASARFRIPDTWKHDLGVKYATRVTEALRALEPRAKRRAEKR